MHRYTTEYNIFVIPIRIVLEPNQIRFRHKIEPIDIILLLFIIDIVYYGI